MSADQTPTADPTPGSSAWRTEQHGGGWVADIASLLAERDDLAARLRAAEAAVERLGRWKAEALPVMRGLQYLGRALGVPIGESITARASVDRALDLRNRAEVAERQAQAVREVAERWVKPRPYLWRQKTMSTRYAGECILDALTPLGPDAPTGHDGHGDPDTHQGDTDADATPEATTQPDESREGGQS